MSPVVTNAFARAWPLRLTALPLGAICCLVTFAAMAQDLTLIAPEESVVGAKVTIEIEGETDPKNFATIVPAGTPEGEYGAYQYARRNPVELTAPVNPGDYEIRLLAAARPYGTLWRQALTVIDATASLDAPPSVDGGTEFEVAWTGPNNAQDFIAIVPVGSPEGHYDRGYRYTKRGSPVQITAPEAAGDYEIRYLMGAPPYRTLGSRPLTVGRISATVSVPAEINAGSRFEADWEGPDNAQDFLTIVPVGAPDSEYGNYAYTKNGNPASILAPEVPGSYEVRYLTGQNYTKLASAPIKLLPLSASLQGPATVEARGVAVVRWEGPDNPQDYVIILPAGADNEASGDYAYTARGKELRIQAPDEPGTYEYRYLTGGKHQTLAVLPVTVTPRPVPGRLEVVSEVGAGDRQGAAVVVILDASGSMLQRIDGARRIDIAKDAVAQLIREDLAQDVHFSLRVFGHKEKDSCRTDLEIPLGPLDRSRASSAVASVEAMNLARTPIAATLSKAGADLAAVSGPKLIILLTDGEETCDGDPAAAISSLRDSGLGVRVNIVGLAIDELMLRETFQAWARLGGGQYFDAHSAEELTAGLSRAIDRPFQVLDAAGAIVAQGTVNGPEVELPAGDYTVRTVGGEEQHAVRIEAGELAVITF